MPGFVWVKTISGTRTAGFFAFQVSDGKLYSPDGTSPPLSSTMIFGEELITMISKSLPKGMYVRAWHENQHEWYRYLHSTWNKYLDAYFTLNKTIAMVLDAAGIPSPHNSAKDVLAEKKAGAKIKKAKIELEFKDNIVTTLQLLKPMTVRALAHIYQNDLSSRPCPARIQSTLVYKFYRKSTEQENRNMKFMVENRLTYIIFPKIHTYDKMTQIWATDDEWPEYLRLTTKMNIAPLSEMQEELCQHFVIKKNKKVIAGASIMTANINNSNKRICVSVELLVSSQKGNANIFHRILSTNIKKRAGTSYMVTQALDSTRASVFWNKHMARHREADALTFMFFMIDNRYKLCEGVTNLRVTF